MIKRILLIGILISIVMGQDRTPAMYWQSLEMKEKSAFINGVYATGAKLKYHHKQEINKQYNHCLLYTSPSPRD